MKKPVVLIVMDGIGCRESDFGNAVKSAKTPTLDYLSKNHPTIQIKAHGTAVGLPSDDDMGNSEVGHNAIGCGQIYDQGAKLVNKSISTGTVYQSPVWNELTENVKKHGTTLHFIGLLSNGNVHSNIAHLKSMLTQAKNDGLKTVMIHILLDGRDVPATSALIFVDDLEAHIAELNGSGFDAKIASGGGRMKVTMDRYEADWGMVELGWKTHVLGEGRTFSSAKEAIEAYREEFGCNDQDLPAFVISENGAPVGKITDNDSVILFNFRGDRAIEISKAFEEDNFNKFNRKKVNVVYAGMLQYDGDAGIPSRYLVAQPEIRDTLTEYLIEHNISEFAVSETQKFGHVTYFWNGNRAEKFSEALEAYCEIQSDRVSFEERPWMKAAEVTDKVIEAMKSGKYGFIRANYPNGDMVGHTGSFDATVIAVEAVDLCLARVLKAAKDYGCILIVTADHGNADEMYEKTKTGEPKPKTAHTLSPVPFIIYAPGMDIEFVDGEYGLSNIASTVTDLLGLPRNNKWNESMIKING